MKSSGEQKSQIYLPVSVREGSLLCKLGCGSSPRCEVKMALVKSRSSSHTRVQRPPLRNGKVIVIYMVTAIYRSTLQKI